MTEEKRQPREQIASHTYKRPGVPAHSAHPASSVPRRRVADDAAQKALYTARAGTPSRAETGPQRRVKQLDRVQPTAGEEFVHRRNQLYSARASSPTYNTRVKPRTLAQTGVPASSGQMRAIHPARKALPQQRNPVVPVRSGHGGRTQGQRKGFLWKVLGIFAVLAIMVLGASFALTGTAFRVAQVNVTGTHNDALIEGIQHMGMQGQNIFLIDVTSLTARIDALPMVASASLEKQWPNQLQVTVVERQPVLLWKTQQSVYSVDKNGVVIAPASVTTGAATLPIVVDTRTTGKNTAQAIHPGAQLNQTDIAFAVATFAGLVKAGITDYTLRYVNTAPGQQQNQNTGGQGTSNFTGTYVVASKAGWVAYLGGPNDANPLSNRLMELQQILAFAQQQQLNLATIDVRFGLRPVYTLKS